MIGKVLFIGNSHLACVKEALDAAPEIGSGISIDYMAFAKRQAVDFDILDGVLQRVKEGKRPREEAAEPEEEIQVTTTRTEATIANYDAIVVVGMGTSLRWMARIYRSRRLMKHHREGFGLLSKAAFDAAVDDGILRSGAWDLISKLRRCTTVPMALMPEPLLNQAVTEEQEWGDVWTGDHAPFLVSAYEECLRKHISSLDVEVLAPPAETVVDNTFTKREYGKTKRGRLVDVRHMNQEYGRLVCREISAWMSKVQDKAPAAAGE